MGILIARLDKEDDVSWVAIFKDLRCRVTKVELLLPDDKHNMKMSFMSSILFSTTYILG